MERLTVVMPVYNEGAHIAQVLEGLAGTLRHPVHVTLVYDFEEDDTLAPARQAANELSMNLRLVRNAYGRSALNAIKTGLDVAETEYVVVMMADLSDPPEVINRMVDMAWQEGADVVCASRYMPGGRQIGGPLVKRTLSRMAGVSLYRLTSLPTHDVTNSFKLYAKRAFESIKIESTGGFELGMEMTVKAHAMGFRVCEVPTTWRDRPTGKSRFRLLAWLPSYLRWYLYALRHDWFGSPHRPRNP